MDSGGVLNGSLVPSDLRCGPSVDNSHLYVPLICAVFGFPALVITVLCLIQYRNRRLQLRESERLHNRRLSAFGESPSRFFRRIEDDPLDNWEADTQWELLRRRSFESDAEL
ncbi:hypothetical protein QR680_017443 [Steinernema hermaphroditum]|uniref:Uncharacterized protein n=1 Tax=Steinernema hermaphroditum TaxID=289476 RepID=A0AA39HGK8_9BILA|nr:hypothetical protein QR680_017443 [Steinernema hermaphroditum]